MSEHIGHNHSIAYLEQRSPKLKDKRELLKMIPMRNEWNLNRRVKDGSEISLTIHF